MGHIQADLHCSAFVLSEQVEQGRLAVLAAYMARMRNGLSSAANGMYGLLDKKVFVLEPENIELVDTCLYRSTVLMSRLPQGSVSPDSRHFSVSSRFGGCGG